MNRSDPTLSLQRRYHLTSRRSLFASLAAAAAALTSSARAHGPRRGSGIKPRFFADLKHVQAASRVEAIHFVSGAYRVQTADGQYADYAAADLRFVVDSTELGPYSGRPVILSAGQGGDRALVFFAKPNEISTFLITDA